MVPNSMIFLEMEKEVYYEGQFFQIFNGKEASWNCILKIK